MGVQKAGYGAEEDRVRMEASGAKENFESQLSICQRLCYLQITELFQSSFTYKWE